MNQEPHPQPDQHTDAQLALLNQNQQGPDAQNIDPMAGIPAGWLEVQPQVDVVDTHEVSATKVVLKGVKDAIRAGRATRQASKARNAARKAHSSDSQTDTADDADHSSDPDQGATTQPESAFSKFTRESKKARTKNSIKNRISAHLEGRKSKKEARTNGARITQLEDELSGASSTIATGRHLSLEKINVLTKDPNYEGDDKYTQVKSMRTYRLDEQGKKRLMTNEQKLAYEQKVQELNALRGPVVAANTEAPQVVEGSDEEFTAYLDGLTDEQTESVQELMNSIPEINDLLTNKMNNLQRKEIISKFLDGQITADEILEEDFTRFLDSLSDGETESIQELMANDPDLANRLENEMSNQERKDFISSFLQSETQNSKGDWRDLSDASELPIHDVKRFFDSVPATELKMLESYSPEDRDTYISMWLNDNPREKAANYMTEDLFNEFLDSLSDDEYDAFADIAESEQNQLAIEWYKANKGPKVIVHPTGTSRGQVTKVFDYSKLGPKRTFKATSKPHPHKKKFMTRVLDRAAARTDKIVDILDQNTLGKTTKSQKDKVEGPGIVKRSAKATVRGADRSLDFLTNRVGRYSIPRDNR